MQDFHQLNVWKKAHELVLKIYKASNELPASENFGLVLNLRRSAVTIARSIAEGAGRDSDVEFASELKRAGAAGHELDYNLLLSRDLGFMPCELHDELSAELLEVRKMISGLVKKMSSETRATR
ncbi:MAG TPA: four helix bundle protein [Acidobacteriaceae bacterium]|nr:four helix bundle protein [Acidobacteriaceae bacterium]